MIKFKNSITNDGLPYDFEVEYIEKASGNAYFEYPFSCHNVDAGETAFSMPISSGDLKISGCTVPYVAATINGNYRHAARGHWISLDETTPVQINKKVIVGVKDKSTYFFNIDDKTYTKQVDVFIPAEDDKARSNNLYTLFAYIDSTSDQIMTSFTPNGSRLFHSIRYDGRTKELLNFIYPVSVNGQVMLYDRAQNNFLQQIGTGTFSAGPKTASRPTPKQA